MDFTLYILVFACAYLNGVSCGYRYKTKLYNFFLWLGNKIKKKKDYEVGYEHTPRREKYDIDEIDDKYSSETFTIDTHSVRIPYINIGRGKILVNYGTNIESLKSQINEAIEKEDYELADLLTKRIETLQNNKTK